VHNRQVIQTTAEVRGLPYVFPEEMAMALTGQPGKLDAARPPAKD